jgi:hypothetical protein
LFREEWDTVVCDLDFGHPSKHSYTVLFSFELIFIKNAGGTKTTYPSFVDWGRSLFQCLGDSLVSVSISLLLLKEQKHKLSTLLLNWNFKLILIGCHHHRSFHFQQYYQLQLLQLQPLWHYIFRNQIGLQSQNQADYSLSLSLTRILEKSFHSKPIDGKF